MNRLGRYIFLQCAGPLFFFTLILTGVVWLSQSLQMLDLVVNRGQSAGTFVYLSVLIFPSLLSDVLPIALFSAVFYTLHHLQNDSELVVMWSAGYSRWSITWPILTLAAFAMVFNLFLNLYLMPAGYRAMKDEVYKIRGDLATQLIKEGTFTNPSKGTYMAESGVLVRKQQEPELVMKEGVIQSINDPNRPPTFTSFEKYSLDLSAFISEQNEVRREYRERYLSELFAPDLNKAWDRDNANRLRAEGHNRLAIPFYNIAFSLIAVVAVAGGTFSRRGQGWRLIPAGLSVILVRILGFAAQNATSASLVLAFLQYFLPIGTIIVCLFLISDWRRFLPKLGVPSLPRQPPIVE
jgi:lipopolysaccharide export system permease protein